MLICLIIVKMLPSKSDYLLHKVPRISRTEKIKKHDIPGGLNTGSSGISFKFSIIKVPN